MYYVFSTTFDIYLYDIYLVLDIIRYCKCRLQTIFTTTKISGKSKVVKFSYTKKYLLNTFRPWFTIIIKQKVSYP